LIARWPDTATATLTAAITITSPNVSHRLPPPKSCAPACAAITQSTANQPTARNSVSPAPTYEPRTPKTRRVKTICGKPVRGPVLLSRPITSAAATVPSAVAASPSHTPSPQSVVRVLGRGGKKGKLRHGPLPPGERALGRGAGKKNLKRTSSCAARVRGGGGPGCGTPLG